MNILQQFLQLAERQATIELEPEALAQLVLQRQALFCALQKAADECDDPAELGEILNRIVDLDRKMQERVACVLKGVREELALLRTVENYRAVDGTGQCIDKHG